MCGILGYLNNIIHPRDYYLKKSKLIRHRGPDWNGIYYKNNSESVVICHERLSIVGIDNGSQPIISRCGNYVLSINGEIYNYKNLLNNVLYDRYKCKTTSDCEVIIYLYQEFGYNFIKMLDGIFSFILYDKIKQKVIISRDPIGILPLYTAIDINGSHIICSELKCLESDNMESISVFEPGTYSVYGDNGDNGDNTKWVLEQDAQVYYNPEWKRSEFNKDKNVDTICLELNEKLTEAVKKRLMSDVPFGVLLSGGLDSSLIASITNRMIKDNHSFSGSKLHTFSIGLKDAPDLVAAKKVADFLGTEHHELSFTIQDGLDCIKNLIYHLETYDVTTIRASTPMFLMSRKIKSYGIKMVLSGEGADEIFGGYLYFHQAPNNDEFHRECIKRVTQLHHFDCLRANKSTMAWGLEARVPFLDQKLIDYGIQIHPELKCNKIEKFILRKAFDDTNNPYLPNDILWRQKEQFTDGVGYSWLDELIKFCEVSISDEEFVELDKQYGVKNKEEAYYRKLFEELFPERGHVIKRWIPQTNWDGVSYDPSGRAQKVHTHHDTIN